MTLAALTRADDLLDGTGYQRHADPVIELQLEKAGVRLASSWSSLLTACVTGRWWSLSTGAPFPRLCRDLSKPFANY